MACTWENFMLISPSSSLFVGCQGYSFSDFFLFPTWNGHSGSEISSLEDTLTTAQTTIEIKKKQGTISETLWGEGGGGGLEYGKGHSRRSRMLAHEISVSGRHTTLRQQNSALRRDGLV
jgi:hypothetical protein